MTEQDEAFRKIQSKLSHWDHLTLDNGGKIKAAVEIGAHDFIGKPGWKDKKTIFSETPVCKSMWFVSNLKFVFLVSALRWL